VGNTTRLCTAQVVGGSHPTLQRRQIANVAQVVNGLAERGRVALLGDLKRRPSATRMDQLYDARHPGGEGNFLEVDGRRGCRCGEATIEGGGKRDYVFLSALHFRSQAGDSWPTAGGRITAFSVAGPGNADSSPTRIRDG